MIKHSQQSGMTLIEILVIVLVISVGMITTAKFQGELLHSGATTKARIQALALAQQEIESLRINHNNAASGTESDVAGINAEYERSWTVTGFAGVTGAKHYQSSITWTDSQNRTQSLQLNAVLYPDNMLSATVSEQQEAAKCIFNANSISPCYTPSSGLVPNTNRPITKLDQGQLTALPNDKGIIELTGADYSDSFKGSSVVNGTDLGDKLLVTKKIAGSTVIYMGKGDDIVQINGNLNGSVTVYLGDGDDLLTIAGINGSVSVYGGDGIDTICFTNLDNTSYTDIIDNIENIEILLFSDGYYRLLNGYSTSIDNIPYGCGN